MMSLKGFSQNAIDTTSIQLKKPIARLVIKDLIRGDGANEELVLNKQKINLLENKISLKDSVIVSLESQVGNFDFIILGFDEDNWKDYLGPKHAFVQISNQIPTKVEADRDYVMITVDLEDLKNLIK